MKRLVLMFVLIFSLCSCSAPMAAAYTVPYNNVEYSYEDFEVLKTLMQEQEDTMEAAHQMAEAARQLGYSEAHDVIALAKQEYNEACKIKDEYQAIYNDLQSHWDIKKQEYPEATYIWTYLRERGLSSVVTAGIMGNIMNEVGGNTLTLDVEAQGDYYGICQWSKTYSEVWGASLEEQCNYLRDTIEYEFDTFGYMYKKNFDYESFIALDDIEDAAMAFAKAYERCGSGSYKARKDNAITAYNYFVS